MYKYVNWTNNSIFQQKTIFIDSHYRYSVVVILNVLYKRSLSDEFGQNISNNELFKLPYLSTKYI